MSVHLQVGGNMDGIIEITKDIPCIVQVGVGGNRDGVDEMVDEK